LQKLPVVSKKLRNQSDSLTLRVISLAIFRYDDNLVTRNDYTSSHFHRRSWATLRVIV